MTRKDRDEMSVAVGLCFLLIHHVCDLILIFCRMRNVLLVWVSGFEVSGLCNRLCEKKKLH